MASVNSDVLQILYKYESMKLKWSLRFKQDNPEIAESIKVFFRDRNFYRHHKHYTFVVGELSDGTSHLLVRPATYKKIKEEIEGQIEETLPDVAQTRDVTIIEREKSFQDFQSFKDFRKAQQDEHDKSVERRKREAKKSVRKLRKTLRDNPQALILAFDLKISEHDRRSIILEIGYAMTTLDNPEEMQAFHYIIRDGLRYENTPDNRNRFKFGTSKIMSLREAAEKIQKHIEDADLLVTHSGEYDSHTEFLASCGISLTGKPMFDTQLLATGLLPDGPLIYDLKRLLVNLDISIEDARLNNSGNHAYFSMAAFLALKK